MHFILITGNVQFKAKYSKKSASSCYGSYLRKMVNSSIQFFFCWKLNISLTLTNIPGNIWVDGTDDEKSEGGGTELFVCFERQTFRAHLKLLTKRKNNKTCIMAEVHHYSYTWFKLGGKKKKKRKKFHHWLHETGILLPFPSWMTWYYSRGQFAASGCFSHLNTVSLPQFQRHHLPFKQQTIILFGGGGGWNPDLNALKN